MIWETEPWRKDLRRWHVELTKRSTSYDKRSYITVEKAIFYSAFIMRKLFDCQGKISDTTSQMKIATKRYVVPIDKITILKRTMNENDFLNEAAFCEQRHLRQICGLLIHSLVFELVLHEKTIWGFSVSSDTSNEDNKRFGKVRNIFFINIKDWLDCMEEVTEDKVASIQYTKNEESPLRYDVKVGK